MTKEDKGHYAKKNSPDFVVRPDIAEKIKKFATKRGMPCAAAFKAAKETGISPREIGSTLDALEITITNCQLGLFGHGEEKGSIIKPMERVPEDLEGAIRNSLNNGKITCKSAWEIAEKFEKGKMEVSSACEAIEVKVSSCQLGAFG